MKPAERIERAIKRLHVEAGAERRERTLSDLVRAHEQHKQKTPVSSRRSFRGIMMKQKSTRIAAAVALAVLLIGVFGLGTGSVAFSQVGHVVGSTLTFLKEMILELRARTPTVETPALPGLPDNVVAKEPDPGRRVVVCDARFFTIPEGESDIWEALKEQGIEFLGASVDPEACYVILSAQEAEQFDAIMNLTPRVSPRVMVFEGEQAAIATDVAAFAARFNVSADARNIECALSFHDGQNGFEISGPSVETGGAVLIRVKGMFPVPEDGEGQSSRGDEEVLIRVQVDVQ